VSSWTDGQAAWLCSRRERSFGVMAQDLGEMIRRTGGGGGGIGVSHSSIFWTPFCSLHSCCNRYAEAGNSGRWRCEMMRENSNDAPGLNLASWLACATTSIQIIIINLNHYY